MSNIHLTGFLEDDVFKRPGHLSINNSEDQGVGIINSNLIDYFSIITKIKDTRASRLNIINTGMPVSRNMAIQIIFDNALSTDPELWTTLTLDQLNTLFNIAETLYLYQNMTKDELEHVLITDGIYLNMYVPDSLALSPVSTEVTIANPINATIQIPNWVEYRMYLSEDKSTILTVKLWLNSASFATDYPYTTITEIVPPCPPATLFTLTKNLSQMETTIENSIYNLSRLNLELYTKDQSGCLTFLTRYYLGASNEYVVPFGVIYKGAKPPTTMACRAAIKQFLIDTGLTTIANLQILFPELFVDYQYYVIPLWDHKHELEDRTVYTSISPNHAYMKDELQRLYPALSDDFIDTRMEIILNSKNDMFSLVIPDNLNLDAEKLFDLHPTYNHHSSTDIAYAYMTATTKQLASKLAKVFAVYARTLATSEFNTVTIDGKTYLSFTVTNIELLVLSPESYHSE